MSPPWQAITSPPLRLSFTEGFLPVAFLGRWPSAVAADLGGERSAKSLRSCFFVTIHHEVTQALPA